MSTHMCLRRKKHQARSYMSYIHNEIMRLVGIFQTKQKDLLPRHRTHSDDTLCRGQRGPRHCMGCGWRQDGFRCFFCLVGRNIRCNSMLPWNSKGVPTPFFTFFFVGPLFDSSGRFCDTKYILFLLFPNHMTMPCPPGDLEEAVLHCVSVGFP